ncbi:MAG TPA: hypothetical protein VHD55_03410 [Candidatus Paceibacterota bacterium]|nr:hypothetical protein [Candidatus Paceibacterota bacterium]
MQVVARAARNGFSFSQTRQETAARIAAAEAGKNGKNTPSAKAELRERVAKAKEFKPVPGKKRPKVLAGGKIFSVSRICENTGTVFLLGKNGHEKPYSPGVLTSIF